MNWFSHVSTVCLKTSFYLLNSKSLPSTVSKILIDSLVLSQLVYALPAWGPIQSKSQINRLQLLHNWGTCITANLQRSDHVTCHRKKLKSLSVHSLVKYRCLCAMNNIYTINVIVYSSHQLNLEKITAMKQHVHPDLFCQFFCNLTSTKTRFRHTASHWWNKLPTELFHFLTSQPQSFVV